ncbi:MULTISPECIES: DUF4389 domain-containing protein [Nitrosomonas]|uniref:Uncharacterized protein DUF4389 n=2 Tax=Nitrosomonas eutropha TaxID=916 RepID=A0ABX5MA89_9PROT|nr:MULTISPECIES: DUF4389 domain-containing protein [Nitrosomonas]ABI59280.1 putative lipase [Nitrosomonas eutropha C91]MXS81113.1 DUF4389 domain-containing protein [Nitrosomonas sp. GH22]PXV81065.1 uncharacterized protein DUF4389 [Nitrosomonas eutropha]
MNDEVKQRLQNTETWTRVLFMLLFFFVQGGVKFLIMLLAVFQTVSTLLAGQTNTQLLKLGRQLAMYDYQISLFLTFNSERRPFPFSAWPADTSGYNSSDNQGNQG